MYQRPTIVAGQTAITLNQLIAMQDNGIVETILSASYTKMLNEAAANGIELDTDNITITVRVEGRSHHEAEVGPEGSSPSLRGELDSQRDR